MRCRRGSVDKGACSLGREGTMRADAATSLAPNAGYGVPRRTAACRPAGPARPGRAPHPRGRGSLTARVVAGPGREDDRGPARANLDVAPRAVRGGRSRVIAQEVLVAQLLCHADADLLAALGGGDRIGPAPRAVGQTPERTD